MGWKDGKKPEQYLFTITDDFSENWNALKEKAKKDQKAAKEQAKQAIVNIPILKRWFFIFLPYLI